MNKIDQQILAVTEEFVSRFFKKNIDPERFFFHTIKHTKYVVQSVEEIGKGEKLDQDSINLLKFCAWFHDTGYLIDPINHEKESIKLAKKFLDGKSIAEEQLKAIESCIMSTRWPQTPSNELDKVLCDADMRHLADEKYMDYADLLRQEFEAMKGKRIKKLDFHFLNDSFLSRHHFFTNYGKEVLEKGKQKNMKEINALIEELVSKESDKISNKVLEENEKLKKKLEKRKGYSRGVESMFRLTARNQINLSSIADNKSNILITVNSIVISIIFSVLFSRFERTPAIVIPTLIFLGFNVATIIFAILSTRPNISHGTFTKEDIRQNKVNMLFFGNFYNMEYEDYEWAIQELMDNDDHLYSTMTKDQYNLGKVLAKKYKLLRIAYNIFMVGIIISVLAFVIIPNFYN